MTTARGISVGLAAFIALWLASPAAAQKALDGYPKTDIGYPLWLAASPDGSHLATAYYVNFGGNQTGGVFVREQRVFFGDAFWSGWFQLFPAEGDSMKFAPDNRTLAVVSLEGTVVLLDSASSKDRHTFKPAKGKWLAAAFSPDSKLLATGGTDGGPTAGNPGVLKVWDAIRLKEKPGPALRGTAVTALAFAPDGKTAVIGSEDGSVAVWSVEGTTVAPAADKHDGAVSAIQFAPDGASFLTGGRDKSVRLWDAAGAKEKLFFAGHARSIRQVGFAPDGKTPYSVGDDDTLRFWDVKTEKERAIMKSTHGAAFVLGKEKTHKILVTSPDSLSLQKSALIAWDVSEFLEKPPVAEPKPDDKKKD